MVMDFGRKNFSYSQIKKKIITKHLYILVSDNHMAALMEKDKYLNTSLEDVRILLGRNEQRR